MFTSRAEFRLSLRADNADQRLTPLAIELGCCGEDRRVAFQEKAGKLARAKGLLDAKSYTPKEANAAGLSVGQDGTRRTGFQLLAFPKTQFADLIPLIPEAAETEVPIQRQLERDALYANYLDRQQKDIEVLKKDEAHEIPGDFEYAALVGLSKELKTKLNAARPENLAQAARIDGMTPAALTLILANLKRKTPRKRA